MNFNRGYTRRLFAFTLCTLALAFALDRGTTAQVPPRNAPPPGSRFGDPLPGLDDAQLAAFQAGREEFLNVETPATGLGPIFNGASCVQCHNGPAPGGGSPITVTRFGHVTDGVFDPLEALGGSLLQRLALDPAVRETIPREANVVANRLSTPLFGAGLIEAIPDGAILAGLRLQKPDGVRGRPAHIVDPASGTQRIGRFGWKGQHASLLAFAGDAYRNEMGITNRLFPVENAPNGRTDLLAAFDRLPDPEDAVDPATGRSDIDAAADFMRLLAPPQPLRQTQSAAAGERVFADIGCVHCHHPLLQTGPHPVAALDRKPVALYSDLLLHDMGALGDGIAQGAAGMREMRTAPLWGLRARMPFLHDGRAATVDQAIRAHDGEAAAIRDRYLRLSPATAQQLLDFLGTI